MMKKEKKPHGVQLLLRAVVRDPEGKVISDTGKKPARSFVIQFLEFIGAMLQSLADMTATATDGSGDIMYRHTSTPTFQFRGVAPINESRYGVVVGTGDTAEDNTDHKLATQLTEGAGVGNITHASVVVTATALVGPNVDMEIKRAFTNNTGLTITVKEAGIYVYMVTGTFFHCIIRDVLTSPIDVPDKCSLIIIYTVRTTV